MVKSEIPIDLELVSGFLDEADEALAELDSRFIELESAADKIPIIDAIFRPVHSIKGNSGFFGLGQIKAFSHDLETLLDDLRKGRLGISAAITDVLLAGVDELKAMIARVRGGEPEVDDPHALEELTERIKQATASAALSVEEASGKLVTEVQGLVAAIDSNDILSSYPALKENLGRIGTCLQSLQGLIEAPDEKKGQDAADGEQYFFGDADVTAEVRCVDDLLGLAPREQTDTAEKLGQGLEALAARLDGAAAELVLEMADELGVFAASAAGYDDLIHDLLQEKFASLCERLEKRSRADSKQQTEEPQAEKAAARDTVSGSKKAVAAKTMRVNEQKVDQFMKFVGELIISAESLNYINKKLEAIDVDRQILAEFQAANAHFSELSDNLQQSLMEIRKVSVKGILQKVPRMARDLAQAAAKKVQAVTEGNDVAIDKSLFEVLGDPLTHMVRNSIDHGIESPEDRLAVGKPETGALAVSAVEDGDWIRIIVKDDGAGINVEKVKAKAVEKGILDAAQAARLTDHQTYQLIFAPGFSTAEKVTEVSGRGVGMDVVMTNIKKVNGQVEVKSSPGVGTEVILSLPAAVTVEVITGLVVCVGPERYILPLSSIRESLKPDRKSLTRIADGAEALLIRDELYPLVRLHKQFNVTPNVHDPWEGLVVIVAEGAQTAALLVDELRTVQQVVVKPLGPQFQALAPIAGGAVLGDGRIGLVLDVQGLLGNVLQREGHLV
jgi:two-component system chemotaxis sensor kinase CheA